MRSEPLPLNEILYRDLRCGDCLVFPDGTVELVLEASPHDVCVVKLNSRWEPEPVWTGHDSGSVNEVYTAIATLIRREP